ncbi:MAG: FHA domain-containing protein [Planctomycetaceae bacterium]
MIEMLTQPERRQRILSATEQFWLVPVLESPEIPAFVLREGETEIGSEAACDVCLSVPGVEARHCSIRVDQGRAVLIAHSRMTWVDDGPVRKAFLKPGQRLAVGPVEFRVEQRTETSAPNPLEHVDLLRRILTEELGAHHTQAAHPSTRIALRDAAASRTVTDDSEARPRPSGTEASPDAAVRPHELDRRQRLLEELKASVQDQTLANLQLLKDQTTAQREARVELEARRQELLTELAAVRKERADLAERLDELNRRWRRLTDDEQSLCSRRAELEQSTEQVEEERREQYHRENLLQRRIEEVNQSEAAVAVREAELLKNRQELEAERSAWAARSNPSVEESASRPGEWETQRTELEASVESLRAALNEKTEALWQRQTEDRSRQEALAERESQLTRRIEDIDRQAAELKQKQDSIQQAAAKLDERARALSVQEQSLQTEQESLTAQRDKIETDRQAFKEQLQALEVREQEIRRLEVRVSDQTAELDRREQERAVREESIRVRERELDERAESDVAIHSDEQSSERADLDQWRQSLADEQARLAKDAAALREQQESLSADRSEVRQSQAELQEHIAELEAAREELNEEQSRFENERAQFLRDRETFAAEQARAATRDMQTGESPHSLESEIHDQTAPTDADRPDDYEVCDALVAASATEMDDEVVDDVPERHSAVEALPATEESPDPNESGGALRSQLAALFGMSASELNARARSHTVPPTPPPAAAPRNRLRTSPVPQPPIEQPSEECAAETAAEPELVDQPQPADATADAVESSPSHDPIAAYMERLLARNRQGVQGARVASPVAAPSPVQSTLPRVPAAPPAQQLTQPTEPKVTAAADSSVRVSRKRPDATLERANIDAFRDLANLSARTAVAKHNSSSVRNRFIALAITTAALFVSWIVLMTAHLWTGESYVSWGLVAAASMCAAALQLLKTLTQLQWGVGMPGMPGEEPDETSQDPVLMFIRLLARVAERLSISRRKDSSDHRSSEDRSRGDD